MIRVAKYTHYRLAAMLFAVAAVCLLEETASAQQDDPLIYGGQLDFSGPVQQEFLAKLIGSSEERKSYSWPAVSDGKAMLFTGQDQVLNGGGSLWEAHPENPAPRKATGRHLSLAGKANPGDVVLLTNENRRTLPLVYVGERRFPGSKREYSFFIYPYSNRVGLQLNTMPMRWSEEFCVAYQIQASVKESSLMWIDDDVALPAGKSLPVKWRNYKSEFKGRKTFFHERTTFWKEGRSTWQLFRRRDSKPDLIAWQRCTIIDDYHKVDLESLRTIREQNRNRFLVGGQVSSGRPNPDGPSQIIRLPAVLDGGFADSQWDWIRKNAPKGFYVSGSNPDSETNAQSSGTRFWVKRDLQFHRSSPVPFIVERWYLLPSDPKALEKDVNLLRSGQNGTFDDSTAVSFVGSEKPWAKPGAKLGTSNKFALDLLEGKTLEDFDQEEDWTLTFANVGNDNRVTYMTRDILRDMWTQRGEQFKKAGIDTPDYLNSVILLALVDGKVVRENIPFKSYEVESRGVTQTIRIRLDHGRVVSAVPE